MTDDLVKRLLAMADDLPNGDPDANTIREAATRLSSPPGEDKVEAVARAPWRDVMRENIGRFDVAAAIGGSATWNAEGSAAMAKLLKEMCRIIDDEVNARAAIAALPAQTTGEWMWHAALDAIQEIPTPADRDEAVWTDALEAAFQAIKALPLSEAPR